MKKNLYKLSRRSVFHGFSSILLPTSLHAKKISDDLSSTCTQRLNISPDRNSIYYKSRQKFSNNKEVRLSNFGGIPDGSLCGTGTDNTFALQSLLQAAASGEYRRIIIDPGIYCFDGLLFAKTDQMNDLVIEAWGATLIARKPTARAGERFFHIKNTRSLGNLLSIRGLEIAASRPSVRTPNVDMILIEGFRSVHLENVNVPCADNMAISFDRTSSKGWIPDEIVCKDLMIGGRVFETPHSHGSIGDTGIYIPRGAKWIDVDAKIQSTGDDACYLGPIPVIDGCPVARGAFHLHLDARETICAFHTEMPNGVLTGRADTTLNAAVACNPAVDGEPENRIDNIRINVEIINAGMLTLGSIGSKIIPQVNNCGIWLYGSGKGINLSGTTMRNIKGPGLLLQAAEGQVLEGITGHLIMDRVMVNSAGSSLGGDGAAIKRSRTGTGTVREVSLRLDIQKSTCPILLWLQSGSNDEGRITLEITLRNYSLDEKTYGGPALAHFHAAGAGRTKDATLTIDQVEGETWLGRLRMSGSNRVGDASLRIKRGKRPKA